MSLETQPIFIVGSGRCGTRTLYRMITGAEDIEIYHEFACTHVQKIAALYYMGRINQAALKQELMELYGSAILYSRSRVWIDSSNKASWLITPLAELFPKAKFLALVRDGRKVVSSFFYKLRKEIYDDFSTSILQQWLKNPGYLPPPPPEKKYWWNIPQTGQNMHLEFQYFNQFQRICWHWLECNLQILKAFEQLPANRTRIVRLEDLVSELSVLRDTLHFLDIDYDDIYQEYLKTPRNVFYPLDFQLTPTQLDQFNFICEDMMKRFEYDKRRIYAVKY